MAGEMIHVDPTEWPVHKAVADALGSQLWPFDQYQGPYIKWNGRRLFIHNPEKMWCALILGEGWVFGFDSKKGATSEVNLVLEKYGITHPDSSDFVQEDNVENYLIATDDVSCLSTPTYPHAKGVADFLVDAIRAMK